VFQPCGVGRREGLGSGVLALVGEVCGVVGPVASGVADPAHGGAVGDAEQFGEHGGGQLGGEVDQV
jgi:hypothetical protein